MRRMLNEIELINTRRKLRELEELYLTHEREQDGDEEMRELSMESLKRLINQLKEEIACSQGVAPAPR
jgi:hypothetical protein